MERVEIRATKMIPELRKKSNKIRFNGLESKQLRKEKAERFHKVGSWAAGGACSNSDRVKGGLVPDLKQLYSDFQRRQLVVTSNNLWPYFQIKTLQNGTVTPISGIDHSVLNILSEKLNFTYRLVRPPDGKWGGPQPDNTVSGLVGQVARHEAHAAMCALTITHIRETVVDFTMPYFLESLTLVSPAPKEKNRSFAILSPFTFEAWLCIIVMTLLAGPLLYLVSRLLVVRAGEEDGTQYSLQSLSFNMYRSLMFQDNLITSHRWSLRFIFIVWYLFSLYIHALYSGTLTAALAIKAYEEPIDSLYDLAQAHQDGFTISTVRDSSYVTPFKVAKSGIYREVWNLFNHKEPDKSFLSNSEIGIMTILKRRNVFITSLLNSKVRATTLGRENFHIARQTFLPHGNGIACNSGSPIKDTFNRILMRLTEIGLVVKWERDEMNKITQYISPRKGKGPTAITLQHLQAAFFIMVLGFAISAFVLLTEIVVLVLMQTTQ
ncbi:glutamate receptor ionotropic, delta-2-like [Panulirus ornatus]|uniref:glutamate receptor ionotropic, delta-2-like n=1 Tax=Panulirus ornatus TaxID=150431 RepID=UPI003A8A6699